ncbi:MAG: hypothetical protein K2X44_00420 [Magnetospirillum sp.]|nr:hypothetical protein [Magnetospirillum sp.]
MTSYSRVFLGLVVGWLVLHVAVSLALDPYNVFGLPALFDRDGMHMQNDRYAKIEYLSRKGDAPKNYIFGSSRANYYNVEDAAARLGGRWYNFTVSSETPMGVLLKLRWLRQHVGLQRAVIALDFDIFTFRDPLWGTSYKDQIEHPDLTGQSKVDFLANYLFLDWDSLRAMAQELQRPEKLYSSSLETGHYALPHYDAQVREGRYQFRSPLKCYEPMAENYQMTFPAQIEAFRQVVQYVRDEKIDAIFLINPYSQHMAATLPADRFADWSAEMARMTDGVWFFAGFNPLTESDADYYERSHFMRATGRKVLDILAGAPAPSPLIGFYRGADGDELRRRVLENFDKRRLACQGGADADAARGADFSVAATVR